MTDYFYGGQADLFSFYRLPKALFVDPRFRGISAEAKILYGLLLDRMGLSTKNGWPSVHHLHYGGNYDLPLLCRQ